VSEPFEEGAHRIRLKISDDQGEAVGQAAELQAHCKFPPGANRPFVSQNLILNLQNLKFEKAGRYSFDLSVNGKHEASIPLSVVVREGEGPRE